MLKKSIHIITCFISFILLVLPIKILNAPDNIFQNNSSVNSTLQLPRGVLNINDRVGFDDNHYIEFIPASGNLSGRCLSFGIEIKWSIYGVNWEIFMAGPKVDNSTPPEYEDYWDEQWQFIKGITYYDLGFPDYKATFIVNRSVVDNGFYWFIIYVYEGAEEEKDQFTDYMILITNFWFNWNGKKCYLDSNLSLITLVSFGALVFIFKRKKHKK